MPKYIDLLVTDDDFTLDAGRNPVLVHDVDCIAQDLVHMIRETGLLVELVANKDARRRAANLIKLEIAIEEDVRIKPGTVYIEEPELGVFYVVAETLDFGELSLQMEAK